MSHLIFRFQSEVEHTRRYAIAAATRVACQLETRLGVTRVTSRGTNIQGSFKRRSTSQNRVPSSLGADKSVRCDTGEYVKMYSIVAWSLWQQRAAPQTVPEAVSRETKVRSDVVLFAQRGYLWLNVFLKKVEVEIPSSTRLEVFSSKRRRARLSPEVLGSVCLSPERSCLGGRAWRAGLWEL